jgi:peptide chain release factor subunit 1
MAFEDGLGRLLELKSDKYLITSLYLRLAFEDRENFKYKIALKNLMKEQREKLNGGSFTSEAIKSVDADMKKIAAYIESPDNLVGCGGVALFSCGGEGVWEVFKLPLVYRNRLVIDRSPLTRQLIRINEEFGDISAVIIDRKKARLFRIGLSGVAEVLDYFYPEATRSTKFRAQEGKFRQKVSPAVGGGQVPHGYGEHGFNRMIENEVHQHLKYVSDGLFDYYKKNKFDWLILGGVEHIVADFSNHLHSYLRKKLLGSITVDVDLVKPDELVEEALDLLRDTKHRNQKKLIEEFEEKLPSGLSVNGLAPALKALAMGQARMLIVSEGFSHAGFICPESRVLVLEKSNTLCPEGKTPIPIVDIVDDAIEEALGQSAEVEVVADEDVKKKIWGVGAILRFKV